MNPKDLVGAKKAPLSLVPPSAIIAIAEAMGNGADKYGPFNWRDQPIQVRTYVEAALRHLYAFLDGQWAAEDTGISHLSHAMAGLAILNDAFALGAVEDNRSTGPAADLLRAQDKSVHPGTLLKAVHDGKMSVAEALERLGVHGMELADWAAYGQVEQRGEWPPDTRVDGRLTCCGGTEHTLTCPQYR